MRKTCWKTYRDESDTINYQGYGYYQFIDRPMRIPLASINSKTIKLYISIYPDKENIKKAFFALIPILKTKNLTAAIVKSSQMATELFNNTDPFLKTLENREQSDEMPYGKEVCISLSYDRVNINDNNTNTKIKKLLEHCWQALIKANVNIGYIAPCQNHHTIYTTDGLPTPFIYSIESQQNQQHPLPHGKLLADTTEEHTIDVTLDTKKIPRQYIIDMWTFRLSKTLYNLVSARYTLIELIRTQVDTALKAPQNNQLYSLNDCFYLRDYYPKQNDADLTSYPKVEQNLSDYSKEKKSLPHLVTRIILDFFSFINVEVLFNLFDIEDFEQKKLCRWIYACAWHNPPATQLLFRKIIHYIHLLESTQQELNDLTKLHQSRKISSSEFLRIVSDETLIILDEVLPNYFSTNHEESSFHTEPTLSSDSDDDDMSLDEFSDHGYSDEDGSDDEEEEDWLRQTFADESFSQDFSVLESEVCTDIVEFMQDHKANMISDNLFLDSKHKNQRLYDAEQRHQNINYTQLHHLKECIQQERLKAIKLIEEEKARLMHWNIFLSSGESKKDALNLLQIAILNTDPNQQLPNVIRVWQSEKRFYKISDPKKTAVTNLEVIQQTRNMFYRLFSTSSPTKMGTTEIFVRKLQTPLHFKAMTVSAT